MDGLKMGRSVSGVGYLRRNVEVGCARSGCVMGS